MKRLFLIIPVIICFLISSAQQAATLIVSPLKPVQIKDSVLRKELISWSKNIQTPNTLFSIQPSAINFPGMVKPSFIMKNDTFQFVHQQVDTLQYTVSKKYLFAEPEKYTMYSTGLYAVAGQPISVTIPPAFTGKQVYLIIGANTDNLFYDYANGQNWRRMPSVSSAFLLDSGFHFASSPFGGLIYLATQPTTATINATVLFTNVINAPLYKMGQTSLVDWKKKLAASKSPWGEIASEKVTITLPDSTLQKIDDPEKVLSIWNKILTTEYELSQLPSPFLRPMRLVVDEHMAAGFMHSGYPIMIHNSPTARMLSLDIIANPEKLLTPSKGGANWGFFHEIGHNLQNWEWVFDGTTEVGCNLFALYVFDNLLQSREGAHSAISAASQQKYMQDYFGKGANYDAWQKSPFLALILFMQLQKQYGWAPFKTVFKTYLDKPSHAFDISDDAAPNYKQINLDKIDLFVERFSTETKTNLTPFFKAWGIPVSAKTEKKLKHFKTWMPDELKPYLIVKK